MAASSVTLIRVSVGCAAGLALLFGTALRAAPGQTAASSRSPASAVAPSTLAANTMLVPVPGSAPPPPTWDEQLVKTLSTSGFSLVSLSFAAFTFLFGALVGLRNDKDYGDAKHFTELQSKLAVSVYLIAATVVIASVITFLANFAVAFGNRTAGIVSVCLAALLLLGISSLASYLACDVYKRRSVN